MICEAVVEYVPWPGGQVKIHRCPICNAWDYALQGDPEPGVYHCEECGNLFEIKGEP